MRYIALLLLIVLQLALGDLLRVFHWAPNLVVVAILLLGASLPTGTRRAAGILPSAC